MKIFARWFFHSIILGIIVFTLPSLVFAESQNYCNDIQGEAICEIIIFSNKYPLPDYTPDIAEVPAGAKIIFKNEGFIVHTATSTDATPDDNTYLADKGINGVFDTGKLLANEIAEPIILNDEGKYHYFCTIHKEMRGTIIVKDPNKKNDITIQNEKSIPQWIRNNAGWWSDGLISDQDFISGIQYMISKKILTIPVDNTMIDNKSNEIPIWIRNNAGWWASQQISDSEFISSIQHLMKKKIIQIPNNNSLKESKLPATSGTVVNFYVNDDDLNTSHNGIDSVATAGLVVATVNGIPISIPEEMVETEVDSGRFYLRIELPNTINGKPLEQDDKIEIKYFDQSDSTGNPRTVVSSTTLSKSFAKLSTQGNNHQRIGHHFTLSVFEPDANRDSKDEDKIPLSALQFRSEGGIRVPLSNSAFDANSSFLIETGPNTDVFEVMIKIPRTINGKTIHIGDWYEIRYIDASTPSNTPEKVIFKGRIG